MVYGRKTDSVTQTVFEFFFKAALRKNFTRRTIDVSRSHPGLDPRECRFPRREDRFVHATLSIVRRTETKRARDVCPITVDVRVAVDQHQIAGLDFSRTRTLVSRIRFRRICSRHAEDKTARACGRVFSGE